MTIYKLALGTLVFAGLTALVSLSAGLTMLMVSWILFSVDGLERRA